MMKHEYRLVDEAPPANNGLACLGWFDRGLTPPSG